MPKEAYKPLPIEKYAAMPALFLSKILEEPMVPALKCSIAAMAIENLVNQAHYITVKSEMRRTSGRAQRNFDVGSKLLAQFLKKSDLLRKV